MPLPPPNLAARRGCTPPLLQWFLSALLDGMISHPGMTADSCSAKACCCWFENLWPALQLDLPTGEGMQQCFDHLGPVDVVINCAAISSPAACEKEVQTARSASPVSPV